MNEFISRKAYHSAVSNYVGAWKNGKTLQIKARFQSRNQITARNTRKLIGQRSENNFPDLIASV